MHGVYVTSLINVSSTTYDHILLYYQLINFNYVQTTSTNYKVQVRIFVVKVDILM